MANKKRGTFNSRRRTEPKAGSSVPSQAVALAVAAPSSRRIPAWRLWLFRLTLILLPPCLFLGAIEGCLRLFRYGYPTRFFVSMDGGQTLTTNRKFAWQFYPRETATQPHPVFMPATKPPGTTRIFILGESAAAGTPDPAFGFARILEVMLRRQYPDQRFEVINAAMRGINSHIVLPIARECARHQPDLFVVYMANNEVIGLHSPEPTGLNLTPSLKLLRLGQWMKSTRLAQLLESGIRLAQKPGASKPHKQDIEYFRKHRLAADDPRRPAIYDNFRANLEDICETIRNAGAKVILSTLAANLKDFPPLGSLHRANLTEAEKARWDTAYAEGIAAEKSGRHEQAIQHYTEALRVDDHFAELHFRLGRCHAAMGQFEKAREHYTLARDWDAMQFRTDSRLNEIIRQFATGQETRGIYFVDAERTFADSPLSDHKTPGAKLFNDHVHFTFDGDYLLARTIIDPVKNALNLGAPAGQPLSKNACAELLAFTSWDEFNVAEAMVRMTAHPPFIDQLDHAERQQRAEQAVTNRLNGFRREELDRAIQTYHRAIAQNTNDWQLQFNFGNLLSDMKDYPAAIAQYEIANKLRPKLLPARLTLGDVLMKVGRIDEAIQQLTEALQIDPDSAPAQAALAQAEVFRSKRR